MDGNDVPNVGVFVIILFLLIGLIVMGCMLYWNWSHRKQTAAEGREAFGSGNACIYEKTNPRAYNRSTSLIITAATHPFTGSDAENGSIVVQKQ